MLLVCDLSRQAAVSYPLSIGLESFLVAIPKLEEGKLSLLDRSDVFLLEAFGKYPEAAEALLNEP